MAFRFLCSNEKEQLIDEIEEVNKDLETMLEISLLLLQLVSFLEFN